ncbi:MAG: DUF2490 domain-containing protein [Pontiellaceae bacterium]|nr:DUF2490 domain-containing protein [Pontiellaceae bacterium]
MKLKTTRIAIIALLMSTAGAKAWDAEENQIWMDGSISRKVAEKLNLKLSEQMRYKDEGIFYCYKHTDLCAAYTLNKAWQISSGFRHITTRKSNTSDWATKEMFHVNLINTLPLGGVDFKTRLRCCYTEADNTDYLMDVRPEFCFMPKKGFTDWKLKPYLSDEIMFNLNEAHLYRNRVNIGLTLAPTANLSLKLFVMHENTQKTEEKDFNENFNYGLFASYKF